MDTDSDCNEVLTVTFEWTLRGLKNLFDSTKGDKKSKVTKSVRFGNGKWQILFYANAGQQKEGSEGGFISLFLACEPTAEEKEAALAHSGCWVRGGVYRFSFELRNLTKTVLYNSKEAHNHTFTYKTANWGWPQFTRRDSVYYQSMQAKTQDAFVIICTIHSSPTPPRVWTIPRQLIPKTLLDTVGGLLDDPSYSDVEFVIAKRQHDHPNDRSIYASKKMLCRADYFQTMFTSGFAENAKGTTDIEITPKTVAHSLNSPITHTSIMEELEDSDDEDEEIFRSSSSNDMQIDLKSGAQESSVSLDENTTVFSADSDDLPGRNDVPEASETSVDVSLQGTLLQNVPSQDPISSSKARIQVRDVAYTTYRAMLYYIYTDNIVFAPLSSSFQPSVLETSAMLTEAAPSAPSEDSELPEVGTLVHDNARSRAEWIRDWLRANPGRPAPCSAKSIYRLADRLDLSELKDRATQHIIKSLTVDNIAFEIFSPFAATYEALRKTEIEFFLNHWNEIRSSDVMKNVWVQIRNGKHPGFEQVWPLIAENLEFRPARSTTDHVANGSDLA